jgi:glycogen debranching enzyme
MVELLWDEQAGIFNALHQGQPLPVITLFNLLPLITGRLPQTITQHLIAHLTDPKTFWTQWPLPTVAAADPKFDPMQMWRGPTWVNINYLFIEGLRRIGQDQLADELTRKTLAVMMQHADIYEYYNPLTGERPPKAAPIFGWSSAVFIDLAIQQTKLQSSSLPG